MRRCFFATIAAATLLVPALASAQVKTVYIPGAHPRVVVIPDRTETPGAKVERPSLMPADVIAIHTPMAAAHRVNPRVNYSAVAHCDRLIADARAALKKSF